VTALDLAYVTLALTPGIGRVRLDALLAAFGSPAAVLAAPRKALAAVPAMSHPAAGAIVRASSHSAQRLIARTEDLGGVVLVPGDPRFPEMLRTIPESPTLLFAKGNLELLEGPTVAIVGSRTHTRYGAEACRHFASSLAKVGLVVVSGMARGLDAIAHSACLDAGGGTVGILGNGLGVVYPAANRALYDRVGAEGCILTEFPPGERPHAGSFPKRNRLISGLAEVTLVVEAREKSGTLITVDCALAQGREAMAVPGPINSPTSVGCNRLIQQGAKPALGPRDVLEEYGLAAEDRPSVRVPRNLTPDERRVLDLLEAGLETVDDMARRLGQSVGDTSATLTMLEIRGLVAQEPGKIFRRVSGLESLAQA
jgi:DNA processing protein